MLKSGRFWLVVGVFFVMGVALSFTPCVLPMLPILSSIIAGSAAPVSRARALGLAASYSLGMALVYAGLGVAAGLAGEGLAARPAIAAGAGVVRADAGVPSRCRCSTSTSCACPPRWPRA